MLSKELEATLNTAFRDAREKRHEFMTVEHLLLALLDNGDASKVLKACGVQIDKLRADLETFLTETTPVLGDKDERETQPTLGFQRVLQRAVFHVQSSGKKEVTGANVLVAIFGERESQAVYFLNRQNITRLDVVNYISHGISKVHDSEEGDAFSAAPAQKRRNPGDGQGQSPLEAYAVNLNQQALLGKIDPLIGRRSEIQRTIQILCRRRKNNPLYVGKPGWARPPSPKASQNSSSTATYPRCSKNPPSMRSTSAHCSLAPSTAVISRSASRPCSRPSMANPARCCSSMKSTPSSARERPPAA